MLTARVTPGLLRLERQEAKTSKQDVERVLGTAELEAPRVVSRSELAAPSHS